ncbi:FAD binding domain-containing protein [Ancylobacter pratisalsi]|uniref:NAD(P)-binding protein n=1 Tax=Ancylobacter pratisalsi TaxID=1745854 RepID=A0A6P1YQU6_9HYPH|nr:FAD binding domain-containing protein [Ancylobacter pratisalsi]QIB35749.1 NAD(P)-binding protein [Ancylobacter pratisalsi]
MKAKRIVIVGGSIGGLFAAVLLHRAGFDVQVYERSVHGLEGRGAGLVAQREVFEIMREVGIEHIARIGVVARQRIYLDREGEVIHSQETPQEQLSWDVLFRSFRERLPPERYFGGRAITGVTQDGEEAVVHFADGGTVRADMVIGADGIGSVVRRAVAGVDSRPSYVGYATWRGLVAEGDVPAPAARQLFERFAFYEMPGSHILGYLVAGPDGAIAKGRRRYNWVWYRRYDDTALNDVLTGADGVRRPFSLAPGQVRPEIVAGLREDAARLLPPSFRAAVEAETRPFVHAIFDYATPRMTSGRIALMGDAAFVARPHTAMGVAKAAGDAFALRKALVEHEDLAVALAAYAADRAPRDEAIVAYGRRLGRSLVA